MDYKLCSMEELVAHIVSSNSQKITQQLMYYKKIGNEVMIAKITQARKAAQKQRLLEKIAELDKE